VLNYIPKPIIIICYICWSITSIAVGATSLLAKQYRLLLITWQFCCYGSPTLASTPAHVPCHYTPSGQTEVEVPGVPPRPPGLLSHQSFFVLLLCDCHSPLFSVSSLQTPGPHPLLGTSQTAEPLPPWMYIPCFVYFSCGKDFVFIKSPSGLELWITPPPLAAHLGLPQTAPLTFAVVSQKSHCGYQKSDGLLLVMEQGNNLKRLWPPKHWCVKECFKCTRDAPTYYSLSNYHLLHYFTFGFKSYSFVA